MLLIRDLHFSYGRKTILRGIDLAVDRGEFLGLVGPNGVGKTTFLRVISGVHSPDVGSVTIGDRRLDGIVPKERARLMAVVSQNSSLPDGFSVIELVLMGRNPHLGFLQWEGKKDFEVVRWSMELTQTWHLAQRQVGTLSGGERQRVLIARALAQEAPLLLLDEPTTHLDIFNQSAILNLIVDLQVQENLTIVAAIHDLNSAAHYCDRIAVLAEGRIRDLGTPTEVLTSEMLETVFGAQASIVPHPIDGTPVIIPSRERLRSIGK